MMVAFTVKLTKPWTPEIFMEGCCVVKRKPVRCEKPRPQTATIVSLWFLWFSRMSWTLLWLITTWNTHGFLSLTVIIINNNNNTKETLCNITWEVKRIKMACKLSQLNFLRSAQYLKAIKNPMVWTHYHETQATSFQMSLQFYLSMFFSACHGN